MSFRVKSRIVAAGNLLFAAGVMALAVPFTLGQTGAATAQAASTPASAEYVPTMTFDVASVRENKDVDWPARYSMSIQTEPHTTTFRATNWQIEDLITWAYGLDRHQIVGVPKWPWPTLFTVEAKGDSEADAKLAALTGEQQWAEKQHMLLALLEERFKLKAHWETINGDVYNLVVAKGGPKLAAGGSMPLQTDELKMFGDHPVPPLFQKNDGHGYDFIAHGCSVDELVRIIASQFGRSVIDKTGLTGKYDFVLKYKGRWDSDRPADDMDPMLPLDQALQQELGLKVETAKGPGKVLVIDHIEKPTAN
jgi:uncharacterized protein (TIGR03435 family)